MKKKYHTGIFYPSNKETLDSIIEGVEKRDERPSAMIMPHSDFLSSSSLLKKAFSFIKDKDYCLVIILSPIHSKRRKEDASFSFFEGEENIEATVVHLGAEIREYYAEEESAGEILLEYIKRCVPGCKTAVIYTDILKAKESRDLSAFLSKYNNTKTLFIISTNISAVNDKEEERRMDGERALSALENGENILDLTNKNKVHICARGAVDSVNRIIKGGWKSVALEDYGSVLHAVLWK